MTRAYQMPACPICHVRVRSNARERHAALPHTVPCPYCGDLCVEAQPRYRAQPLTADIRRHLRDLHPDADPAVAATYEPPYKPSTLAREAKQRQRLASLSKDEEVAAAVLRVQVLVGAGKIGEAQDARCALFLLVTQKACARHHVRIIAADA